MSDRTGRLHLLELATGSLKTIDRSEAGEITDVAFSGDSMWLAFARPMPEALEQRGDSRGADRPNHRGVERTHARRGAEVLQMTAVTSSS